MAIIDVVYFFNEVDLLEIRLNFLSRYVDKFVICEGTETFAGDKKQLFFTDRFKKWNKKVVHHIVSDMPKYHTDPLCDQEILKMALHSPNVTYEHICWLREFYYKEHVKKALVGLKDTDTVFVSDCDEFWNPNVLFTVTPSKKTIYRMVQNPYLYYLNCRTDQPKEEWSGTIATKYRNIKDACLNHLRTRRLTPGTDLENGGWHFAMTDGISNRLGRENTPAYSVEYIRNKEKNMRKDGRDLPVPIKAMRRKYPRLFI